MKRRWLFVICALASAASLSVSVGAGRWWTISNEFEIGPFGAQQCTSGECRPANLPLDGGPAWERLAIATGAGCLIASLLLLILAATLAAGRFPKLLGKTVLSALATSALAGGLFIALAPNMAGSLDRGVAFYALGIVLGAIASIKVMRG